MTRDTASKSLALTVAAAVLVGLIAWAASLANASKLDTSRFVADSISRDASAQADHALLQRIDARVGQMYCGRLPADVRGGCQ